MKTVTTVSAYIAAAPPRARKALRQLRALIKGAAPGITERISYRIPTFDLDGQYLLYIAGFEKHVSVYPVTAAMTAKYAEAMAPYRSGKGTLRFPLNAPIPTQLVRRLAQARIEERQKGARPRKGGKDPRR